MVSKTSHHHRASSNLRQTNKKNKPFKSSKRSIKKSDGGRKLGLKSLKLKNNTITTNLKSGRIEGSKIQRLHQKKQKLEKQKLKNKKEGNIPFIVSVINLSDDNDGLKYEDVVCSKLKSFARKIEDGIHYYENTGGNGIRIYSCNKKDVISVLNQCQISNIIILTVSASSLSDVDSRSAYISNDGEKMLTAMKAQGLPLGNIYSVFFSCEESAKKTSSRKKYVQRLMNAEFPTSHSKVYDGMTDNEYKVLLRFMCASASSSAKYISNVPRSYIVSEQGWEFSSMSNEMKMTGFVRNAPLVSSHQVHVSSIGTFAIQRIEDTQKVLVEYCNRENEGVVFANPDALEGEQNLIGFEEEDENVSNNDEDMSDSNTNQPNDYQSAWLDELLDSKDLSEHKSLSNAFNTAPSNMDEDDDGLVLHQRHEEYKRFPDEIELTQEEKARDRLSRYRSIKSFRNSYWDPKENLPEDYGRIFNFENFRITKRNVLQDLEEQFKNSMTTEEDDVIMNDGTEETNPCIVPVGTLITLTIQITNPDHVTLLKNLHSDTLLSVSSLLPHENKVSVLQFSISAIPYWQGTIKSKDVLTIRCGWRTWQCRPLFSHSNLNSNKHKLEKFMPQKGFFTMTAYGPVTYTPCNILVFQGNNQQLVATGSLVDANADRLILKKILLTGFPSRVNKRWATVKYMFYNPEDIKWFQPAPLYTKHGLQGHIMESIGDHGSIKCLFNEPIKQHDTVCLPLYKRVYPKFVISKNNHEMKDDYLVVS